MGLGFRIGDYRLASWNYDLWSFLQLLKIRDLDYLTVEVDPLPQTFHLQSLQKKSDYEFVVSIARVLTSTFQIAACLNSQACLQGQPLDVDSPMPDYFVEVSQLTAELRWSDGPTRIVSHPATSKWSTEKCMSLIVLPRKSRVSRSDIRFAPSDSAISI
ncbi:Dehydrogenase patE [Fusarium oxysporum f. sp. albedinis]|nr:Dehydrogenase patE [Fusarium oxysporum f. sp. albedinis]